MLFNSLTFTIFLAVTFAGYHLFLGKSRKWILLISSIIFYMSFNPVYVVLIMISAYIDYSVARRLDREEKGSTRNKLTIIGIGTNLLLLMSFKYYNFLAEIMNGIIQGMSSSWSLPVHNLLAPLGISFILLSQ